MVSIRTIHNSRKKVLLFVLLVFSAPASLAVNNLSLLALFGAKAILHIDGERRLLSVGQTSPEGVKLISTDAEQAIVEVGGRRESLRLGIATVYPGTAGTVAGNAAGDASVSLWADVRGFFHADGSINGYPVRFLVDTGATTVAISSDMAQRAGIRYSTDKQWLASTAGGTARMVRVTLDSVTVGDIVLRDIPAGIILGSYPEVPLLGMSFLGQLDMVRQGDRMELKKRY